MGCGACRRLLDQEAQERKSGNHSAATDARVRLKRHTRAVHGKSVSGYGSSYASRSGGE
jgi:hypothetical protein